MWRLGMGTDVTNTPRKGMLVSLTLKVCSVNAKIAKL
jgi:hypothetical protein